MASNNDSHIDLIGRIVLKNIEKRKRVMQRSIKLGHCICDPQKPCPCDLLKQKDICLCAGERLESPNGPVLLTRLVEKAGCASKIDQAFLKQTLNNLPVTDDPRVIVGVPAGDDAGIYDIGNGKALVQTVDVFTPSVDDPYLFGQVAAANSVSDIYAMGATPCTALSVLGFPVRKIPDHALSDILRGGIDKMKEAGVAIIGGHSINDSEIKAGFAVTGIIDIDKIVTNSNAAPGDILILTKPLGTGIVAFANQIDMATPDSVAAATDAMTTLNKTASQLMLQFDAHACTDVTGFSLMGHLSEMMLRSSAEAQIIWDDIPFFPGVLQYVANGVLPGAIERNKESCSHLVTADDTLSSAMIDMCFDAQTSGGLLIAVAPEKADAFLKSLHDNNLTDAAIIGKVTGPGNGRVHIKTKGTRTMPEEQQKKTNQPSSKIPESKSSCCGNGKSTADQSSCCPSPPAPSTTDHSCCSTDSAKATDSADLETVQKNFSTFLASTMRPGKLDAFTKVSVALALSVLAKCEPCLKLYIKKAQQMGFSPDEIDEAAWLAIAFGGTPAMMFYKTVTNEINHNPQQNTGDSSCC